MRNDKTSMIIIEDHPVMRKGLADWFQKTGRWNVTGTASALDEAKAILAHLYAKGSKVDMLLLDIQLKDGWGLDIIPWLKKKNAELPLLAVYSAFDDYAHVSAALSMGVKAYVTKYRSESELEKALRTVLDGKTHIDESAQEKFHTAIEVFSLLTKREGEILSFIKDGLSNKQIAVKLGIKRETVDNIVSCIYNKTGIHSRPELLKL